jgi:peptidylprolyl isomerase
MFRRSKLNFNAVFAVRLASAMPESERPAYEVMDTASAEWAALKDSKRDYSAVPAFIAPPVSKLDICSLPVPARQAEPAQP